MCAFIVRHRTPGLNGAAVAADTLNATTGLLQHKHQHYLALLQCPHLEAVVAGLRPHRISVAMRDDKT